MRQRPTWGTVTLTCIVIANMVGAGVYTTSGYSMGALGAPSRVLLAWAIAAMVALCGAVAYGELARRIPHSGGEYLYLSQNLHPFAGFLSGWVSLTAGFSGAIALSGLTFAEYALGTSVPAESLWRSALAASVVVACGLGHSYLQRPTAYAQNGIVVLKLGAMFAFLAIALATGFSRTWHWQELTTEGAAESDAWTALASSVMWISFSFAGFNAAIYIASEVEDARRRVPRALVLGCLIVSAFYLLLNLVFVTATPAEEIVNQPRIAAIAAAAVGGEPLEWLVRGTIMIATLSSVAVMIMAGPRVYARMAEDGLFLKYFSATDGGIHRAVLLQTGLAALLAWSADIVDLLKYLGATLALSSAVCVCTLFRSRPDQHDPVRLNAGRSCCGMSPVVLVSSGVYVIATFVFMILMAVNDPRQLLGTAATLVVGSALWMSVPRTSAGIQTDKTSEGAKDVGGTD